MSLKSQILNQTGNTGRKEVEIPEAPDENGNPTKVWVRGTTIKEFEIHQAKLARQSFSEDGVNAAAFLVSRCVEDENRLRVFRDGDVEQISQLPVSIVSRIVEAIGELSEITDTAVADAEGNSEATTDDTSSSS
jgi:hypothetical protein